VKAFLRRLAARVAAAVENGRAATARRVVGHSPGGDAQFDIDAIAEAAVIDECRASELPIALYSEDAGLVAIHPHPEIILIVDPIDGTRPAAAELGASCISIAAAPYGSDPTIADVGHALLRELQSGRELYASRDGGLECFGYDRPIPPAQRAPSLEQMFWSFEVNGHPTALVFECLGHLIDATANPGGVFIFNSASFSISRVVTGQLDAYVDVGNRILKDRPATRAAFERAGHGHILHLFPYDIAASVLIAEKAGVVITDAYGRSLGATRLLDISAANQQSCVCASTLSLHARILETLRF
jgi:myo-inositol-1(or 4)-monophosphatase